MITTLPDGTEEQFWELVTVKLYVPAVSPDKVEPGPVPIVVVPPGTFVNVHVPVPGKLYKNTVPVDTVHVD